MKIPFEYTDFIQPYHKQENFILLVPPGIHSKTDLFDALANAGHFPDYFGNNWDALLDCLRNFSWIENKQVVILHNDVPLQKNSHECRIYLDILQTAISDWSQPTNPNAIKPPDDWPYVEHELKAVFPTWARVVIEQLESE